MKKLLGIIALGAILSGSVFAIAPVKDTNHTMRQDTTKVKKKKVKMNKYGDTTKMKMKTDSSKM